MQEFYAKFFIRHTVMLMDEAFSYGGATLKLLTDFEYIILSITKNISTILLPQCTFYFTYNLKFICRIT